MQLHKCAQTSGVHKGEFEVQSPLSTGVFVTKSSPGYRPTTLNK